MSTETPDFLKIALHLISGVVVFLYGIHRTTESLKIIAGDSTKRVLHKFTKNTILGTLTGISTTAVLGSSSALIILVITSVDAQLLSFAQSLAVVMGANIGTTLTTQIIAFKLTDFTAVILLSGFLLILLGKSEKRLHLGTVILGIGLIFFGLEAMDDSMRPLHHYPPFIEIMKKLDSAWVGVLIGGLITVLIQASSATVAMAITLASQQMISMEAGIAIMLGAEIGTCSDTLLATIKRSRQALLTGIFHLCFNIITVILGLIFFSFLVQAVNAISSDANVAHKIANAHLLFNMLGTLLFLPFINLIASWLHKLPIHEKEKALVEVEN
jgi:phosphate:Na+ symporter